MTLQQIAERAGVSTPTISKVLNGRPDVAPATRERVLQVLHEQQYLPRGASALPSAHQACRAGIRRPQKPQQPRNIARNRQGGRGAWRSCRGKHSPGEYERPAMDP